MWWSLALKAIPWGKVFKVLAIVGLVVSIVLYIKNAEQNRAKVATLKQEKQALIDANASLVWEHQQAIGVLTDNIHKAKVREKEYDQKIEKILQLPDGECARNSAPIIESIRMRYGQSSN